MQPYLIVLLRRIFLYRFGGHIPQPLSEMLSILGNRRCVRIGSVPENREDLRNVCASRPVREGERSS